LTLCLLGMELGHAQNLLKALNIPYRLSYCAARKPLENTDSVRIMRQRIKAGSLDLTAGAFLTTAGERPNN
jgi:hypothetical protein